MATVRSKLAKVMRIKRGYMTSQKEDEALGFEPAPVTPEQRAAYEREQKMLKRSEHGHRRVGGRR